jgi:hypothetical protein
MARDSLDRLIRQMERWLEEDKRERQRYRQRKKTGTLTESKREWQHSWLGVVEKWRN